MQKNILNSPDISKIYLKFNDGKKNPRNELVKIRYVDKKSVYFAGQSIINFSKPGWRAKCEIVIYTPDGIYITNVIIQETIFSFEEMLYKLELPKTWKYIQRRAGSRKSIVLPITLNFSDETKIETETYDLSIGGFSIINPQELNTVQKKFPCSCEISFPKESVINFPDATLSTPAKFVRLKPIQDEYELRYTKQLCFKFTSLNSEQAMVLKNFLIKIN